MDTVIQAHDLSVLGFTETERKAFLSSTSGEEQIKLLRIARGRLLADIHGRQQTLDQLDYFVHQIKQQKK